jgi:tetratricopeptide (TPR) repeat protein
MIEIKSAEAWLNFSKGDQKEALSLMQEAANMEDSTQKHGVTPGEVLPARELLGDMLLAMNKPKEALNAYELNLKGRPNRFNSIYGAAIASKEIGDNKKANIYFAELIKLTEGSKSNRPEIKEAKDHLNS